MEWKHTSGWRSDDFSAEFVHGLAEHRQRVDQSGEARIDNVHEPRFNQCGRHGEHHALCRRYTGRSTLPQLASDRSVTFDLSANPLLLNTGSHVIRVVANIVGGSSDTFQLSLQRSSDAMFIDDQLNQPVTPTVSSKSFTAVSSSQVTIQSVGSSGVSVTGDPSSPTNDVAAGASSVNLATFDMLASGEPTKVQDLYVCAAVTGGTSGAGYGLQNGKIFLNGVQVGSTKNIVQCSSGAGVASTASTDFSLGSSLILPASQTAQVSVYADMRTSTTTIAGGASVEVDLVAGSANAQGQDSLSSTNVPASDSFGNSLSVTSSSLTANKALGHPPASMLSRVRELQDRLVCVPRGLDET